MTAFGTDQPTAHEAYNTIATSIRNMQVSAVPASCHDDVLTMMEFMRQQLLEQHDVMCKQNEVLALRQRQLKEQEEQLAKRASELATKSRAIIAASGFVSLDAPLPVQVKTRKWWWT